jgi:hypothetical protein
MTAYFFRIRNVPFVHFFLFFSAPGLMQSFAASALDLQKSRMCSKPHWPLVKTDTELAAGFDRRAGRPSSRAASTTQPLPVPDVLGIPPPAGGCALDVAHSQALPGFLTTNPE